MTLRERISSAIENLPWRPSAIRLSPSLQGLIESEGLKIATIRKENLRDVSDQVEFGSISAIEIPLVPDLKVPDGQLWFESGDRIFVKTII